MKVLMVAPFETNGRYKGGIYSIATSVLNATSALDKNGVEIIPFNTCRVARKVGSDGKLNFSNLKNVFRTYFDLIKAIKMNQPQVLYFHTSKGFPLLKDLAMLSLAKHKTGVKTVLHIHFAEYEKIITGKSFFDKYIIQIMKKNTDRIVFLSSKTRDEFVCHGIEAKKCRVIYNFSTLCYIREEMEKKLSHNGATRLLFVGSIDQRKGIFDVLEQLVKMKQEFSFSVCGGFGSEEYRADFEEYAKRLGEKVHFFGYVTGEEKRKAFLDADVLVLTSYAEGLPIVIVEALTAGCAVLTTNVGAIPEIITDVNGKIVEPGNKEQIYEALSCYLSEDRSCLRKQQQYNFEHSDEYYIDAFVESFADACRNF